MSVTPGSIDEMRERVEADKRSIIEMVFKTNSNIFSHLDKESDHIKINKTDSLSDSEYASMFGNENIDDSEDAFKEILKKAEQAFVREREMKKKDPYFRQICDSFKKPPKRARKRKSKAMEDSLNIMNIFKKNLAEAKEEKTNPSDSANRSPKINNITSLKENCIPIQKQTPFKIYPSWKTTETYTPIFPVATNPRWTTKQFTPASNKIQTPDNRGTHNGISDTISTEINAPSSCKNNGSVATMCNSIIDDEGFITPVISPINLSPPVRSTIVRFKPSPPEHILYSNYSSLSISPSSLLTDEKYQDHPEMYQDHTENYQHGPEKHYECKRDIEDKDRDGGNDVSKKTNGNASNDLTKQPFFVEDFIRNLNYNISNNYNMEVKCSMKVKYF